MGIEQIWLYLQQKDITNAFGRVGVVLQETEWMIPWKWTTYILLFIYFELKKQHWFVNNDEDLKTEPIDPRGDYGLSF